jgi:general stress protein 26
LEVSVGEELDSNSGELRHEAWSKLKSLGIVQLTSSDGRGRLQSRPLAVQQADFDGALWFFVTRSSDLASDVERDPRVNVSCMDISEDFYLSASGTARLVHDKAMARDLWNFMSKAWFPGGIDDPELTLLKVAVDHAEVWSSDSNRMVRFFSIATAALLGSKPPGADEHAVIRM